MLSTTAAELEINEALPEDLRSYGRILDKGGVTKLLQQLAETHPDKYRTVVQDMMNLGRRYAYLSGGNTFGLHHLAPGKTTIAARGRINAAISSILNDDKLSSEEKQSRINAAVDAEAGKLTKDLYQESLDEKNPFALQVQSGARGNPVNLRSLRGFDAAYEDHHGDRIAVPILRNYAEGLSPAEYYAGTFGARRGVLDVKRATADAGYFCLARGTLIRMADWSVRPIDQLRVGDWVLGADSVGRTLPVRVSATFMNGVRSCNTYRFRCGKSRTEFIEVTATPQHEVLASRRESRQSRKGTPRKLPLSLANKNRGFSVVASKGFTGTGVREPRALLLGLLLGDGDLTQGTIYLSCADPLLLYDIKDYLDSLGLYLQWRDEKHPYEYSVLDRERSGPGGRNRLRTWLRELGLLGCNSSTKFIPAVVRGWDNESVAALLAGLVATDGCVSKPNTSTTPSISLGMVAKAVIYEARELFRDRFGIHTPSVQVVTAETLRKHAAKRKPSDKIPYVPQAVHDLHSFFINDPGSIQRFLANIDLVGVKRETFARILESTVQADRETDFAYHFNNKQDAGRLETYDIEVDHPDHLYVLANGLIVSNSKQLIQAAHRLLVTDVDDPDDPGNRHRRGLPVDVDDQDSVGGLLAADHGPYKRNTVVTPKILADLRGRGLDQILVRSPLVGGPDDGGVYARDVGIRERGIPRRGTEVETYAGRRLAPEGDYVGIAGSHAVSEKITQGGLSSKHTGGVAGAGPTGFSRINQLAQVPEESPHWSVHAQLDGTVGAIRPAPQGGQFILIGGQEHYVAPDAQLKVKQGDEVEAGDVMTSGLPNPSEIVRHKGIGEGRRYLVTALRSAFKDSKIGANRRNVELVSRGLINHVRMTDSWNDYIPDDVVQYHHLERNWVPRTGAQTVSPESAVGKYLEAPTLHYTIGTKVRKSMLPTLSKFGITNLTTHNDPPPFEPEMQRAAAAISTDEDWQTTMLGSGQKANLLDAAHRGRVSDTMGTSFVPALIAGSPFGKAGPTQGWKP